METKTTIQFDVLDTQMLASIEGGTASAGEVCTLAGAMIGSLNLGWRCFMSTILHSYKGYR